MMVIGRGYRQKVELSIPGGRMSADVIPNSTTRPCRSTVRYSQHRNPTYSKDSRGNTNDIWQITPPTRYSIMPKLKPAVLTGPPVSILRSGERNRYSLLCHRKHTYDVLSAEFIFFSGRHYAKRLSIFNTGYHLVMQFYDFLVMFEFFPVFP